ncbi:hypothetical protein GCM10027403_14590 [Arthrobacter tecti]
MKSAGEVIRRGRVSIVSQAPGLDASAIVQAWLQRGDDHGNKNSVFYFSADSDPSTMYKRAAAIATRYTLDDVEAIIERGETSGLDAEVNAATAHMAFDYRSSPGEDDIIDELEAYLTVHGEYPEVIVVDNARMLGESPAAARKFLGEMAQRCDASVLIIQ